MISFPSYPSAKQLSMFRSAMNHTGFFTEAHCFNSGSSGLLSPFALGLLRYFYIAY